MEVFFGLSIGQILPFVGTGAECVPGFCFLPSDLVFWII